MLEIRIIKDDKLMCDICRKMIGNSLTECLKCGVIICEQDYVINSNKLCSECNAPASYMRSVQNNRIQRALIQSMRDARLNDTNERHRFDSTPSRDGRKLSPPSDSFIRKLYPLVDKIKS